LIYTLTLNPAIDLIIKTDKIEPGKVNRTQYEDIYFGGKGINVSLVLNELGIKSKALGFIAGFTGIAIENETKNAGIETDFVKLKDGFSRINVKIKSELETDINGQGPKITDNDITELFKRLAQIKDGDTIVLAGSVPNTLPTNIYEEILERLSVYNVKAVVDATGDLLKKVLKYKPFLIKPNQDELAEIFGVNISSTDEIIEYAKRLQDMGAKNVLVSMAGNGAILNDENANIHKCESASGSVINSVGAGDSMVAGFLAGTKNGDFSYALKLGTAAGGATAFSEGLAKKEDIDRLLKQLL